jgi:hypothetical protein
MVVRGKSIAVLLPIDGGDDDGELPGREDPIDREIRLQGSAASSEFRISRQPCREAPFTPATRRSATDLSH